MAKISPKTPFWADQFFLQNQRWTRPILRARVLQENCSPRILKLSLSDSEIRKAIRSGEFGTVPRPVKINPAGIDLRIDRDLSLKPGASTLVASLERIELGNSLVATLHLRSSLAREGLFASLALVDPGFRGQLTVRLYNAGDSPVNLQRGERFIQLSLLRLGEPSTRHYSGMYQESRGVVASRRRKKIPNRRMESIIQGARG